MITTRCIDTDTARIAVHARGRGPVALLVHGYPLDHRMWLETLRSPLAARRTLVAVDLRGHGQSPWMGDREHGMDLLANDLADVLTVLTDQPADVVALSMGGYVALALQAQAPHLFRSLCLVDTRATADTDAVRAARFASLTTVVQQGRRAIADSMLGKLLAPQADLLARGRVQSMIEGTPVETILADLQGLMARPDRTPLLSKITVPTLVVVGEHDAITPPAEARAMAAAIPGARCEVVPGAGHMVPIEAPDTFVRLLDSFWRD